jgi:hypothetical protein
VTLATTMTAQAPGRAAPRKSVPTFDEVVAAIERDAGPNLTESKRQLVRRAAALSLQAEMDAGKYSTLSNSLRRILRDLGSGRAR